MNLKTLLAAGTIAASSLFAQDAVAQEVKKDCQRCDQRVEQVHVKRGDHAVQPFKAFVVADGDTSEAYQFKIPRAGDDMRRVHDGADWQMMLPLDSDGELVTPDGDVYLVPTQEGDRILDTPNVGFRGQDAYLVGKRDGFRALMAANGCESSPAGILFGDRPSAQEVEEIINDYLLTQAGDDTTSDLNDQEDRDTKHRYSPHGSRVRASGALSTGSDEYQQHTTRTISTPAERTGTRYSISLDHFSDDVRAQASIGWSSQSQDFDNDHADIDQQSINLQGLYDLGRLAVGGKVDLESKQVTRTGETAREERRFGPQIGYIGKNSHVSGFVQSVQREDAFRGAINLRNEFEGTRYGVSGQARLSLADNAGLELDGSLAFQELAGEVDKVGSLNERLLALNTQARVVKRFSENLEAYLQAGFDHYAGSIETDSWEQDFNESTLYGGIGARIRF